MSLVKHNKPHGSLDDWYRSYLETPADDRHSGVIEGAQRIRKQYERLSWSEVTAVVRKIVNKLSRRTHE